MRTVHLWRGSDQSVLVGAASQAAAIFKRGKQTYLEDTSEGMSLMALLTAIADSKRLEFPG